MIHHGDCLTVMATMPAESVDAIVTDPPYGLSFMGKAWDHGVPAGPFWAEMLRVAKPGAYLLAFGGTRTVHRIATNIEDAGWIIRDMLTWIYASGFPKGRANLKPAWEPIVMARKPGPLRHLNIDECRIEWESPEKAEERAAYGEKYAGRKYGPDGDWPKIQGNQSAAGRWPSNVLLSDPELFDEPNPWVVGSGATAGASGQVEVQRATSGFGGGGGERDFPFYGDTGGYSRFFAIPKRERGWHWCEKHDRREHGKRECGHSEGKAGEREWCLECNPDKGELTDYPTAFIIPKADRADREPVLRGHGLAEGDRVLNSGSSGRTMRDGEWVETHSEPRKRANSHPTVKPTDLMRHLVRLVTPPGGTVLDPFLGSGTTALACELEGFPWIGIEKEAEYVAIAEARLNGVQRGLGLDTPLAQPVRKLDPRVIAGKGPSRPEGASASTWFTTGYPKPDEEPAA